MHKVLDETGRFAVSVLAGDEEDLARYFSDSGRPTGMAQFCPWPAPRPGHRRPPLDGALACLECDVEAAYDGGDHTVSWAGSAGSSGPAPVATRCSTSAATTGAWGTLENRKERPGPGL